MLVKATKQTHFALKNTKTLKIENVSYQNKVEHAKSELSVKK